MYAVEVFSPAYIQDRTAEYTTLRAASASAQQELRQQISTPAVAMPTRTSTPIPSSTASVTAPTALPPVGATRPIAHPSAITQVLMQRPIPVRGHSGVFENIFRGFGAVAAASRTSSPAAMSSGYATPVEKTESESMQAARIRQRDIDIASVPTLMRPW